MVKSSFNKHFNKQILKNKAESIILMVVVFIVFILLGYVIAITTSPGNFFFIMLIATVFSLVYLVVSYYNSAKIAVASVGAKKASKEHHPQYHILIEQLTEEANLPKPELYIMHSQQINAFASGRDPSHAVICVTDGCLQKLSKEELEGVLSHELSHIANFDIRFMTLTAVLVGMVSMAAQFFLHSLFWGGGRDNDNNAMLYVIGIAFAILAPIATTIVQLTISRKREFAADASGAKFAKSPKGLINALKKIGQDHPMQKGRVNKAVAPLFLSDPLKRKVRGLFSTHPPLEDRIKTLESL